MKELMINLGIIFFTLLNLVYCIIFIIILGSFIITVFSFFAYELFFD
jgi:hypothetical protein